MLYSDVMPARNTLLAKQLLMVKLTYNLPTPENGGITTEVLIPNAVPRLCYGVKKIEVVVGWVSVYGKTTPLPRR